MKRIPLLSLIFCLALILAACGKDKSPSPSDESGGGGSRGGSRTITDLRTILDSTDRKSLVGSSVQLDQVRAHDVYWAVFTITQGNSAKLPVAVAVKLAGHDNPRRYHVKKGDLLRLTGVLRNAPPYDANDPFWKDVGPRGRLLIERTGVFINATDIQPSFSATALLEEESAPVEFEDLG